MTRNISLKTQQQEAYNAIANGESIFLTGMSGTGKSVVIRKFREDFGNRLNIGITSTTGISAILIGGTTLHSFLGIGLGTKPAKELAEIIKGKKYYRDRWEKLDTLIIDEVSMLSPELFDKLEEIACTLRGPKQLLMKRKIPPFGGIQIIATGDFLQLPVVKNDKFCFEADSWNRCIQKTFYLTEIIRQEDLVFQRVLNNVRYGIVDDEVRQILDTRLEVKLDDGEALLGIKPTKIFSTNESVDRINDQELKKLKQKEHFCYEMEIEFHQKVFDKITAIEKIKKNCLAPYNLELALGAQVMLLYNLNLEDGLANGSRGVVIDFVEDYPLVKFTNGLEIIITHHTWDLEESGKPYASISQIPLKLAWAITTHKSQGCSLDLAEIDLGNVFEYGQAYVALSRIRNLDGLSIIGIDYNKIQAHPKAIEFYRLLEEKMNIPTHKNTKVKKINM